MSAVDDAKKYLSLRPPMENKTIFALHPDVLVGGLLDEIERLRTTCKELLQHAEYLLSETEKAKEKDVTLLQTRILRARAALKEGE
jgi:hypothetical protein